MLVFNESAAAVRGWADARRERRRRSGCPRRARDTASAPPTARRGGGQGGWARGDRADARAHASADSEDARDVRQRQRRDARKIRLVESGGTVIGIAASADSLIQAFKLPLATHLVENGTPLGRDKYYVPGSVLRVAVDPMNPLAHGYGKEVDVFFDNNPVWRPNPSGGTGDVRAVAWFASPTPLRSGWAWGQKYLDKGIQMAETTVGKGRVLLFGNELLFRSQPHGTFRFFFNGLYLSVAEGMKAGMGQ